MYVEREIFFFPDHKMNEAAEEFHGLCVCSSLCDLEDYWSRLGTATVLPPRGSANKTQLLGKIIARKHQNIPSRASISLALKGFHLPQSCRTLLKRSPITRNRTEEESPSSPPQTCSFSVFPSSAPSSIQLFKPENCESLLTPPCPSPLHLQAPVLSRPF